MRKIIYLAVLSCFSISTATVLAVDENKEAAAVVAPAKRWSPYETVRQPQLPAVAQKGWVRTPVDAFVLAQLEANKLKPSPDTDRATFIRRATLDAWGLLPTPEEVKAFVNDKSPEAYEKLVDRLLASPHFGERQARRWLDLARYADSSGFQNDQTRANAWRYRDYVIAAFNGDKPFDRFVKEQIAGDELYPDSQEARIATGYLANYPDNANSRDLVQRKYQITTDITDNIGETFLASTTGCARCHNHKSDKLTQKDYFSLQAFFANTSFDWRLPLAKGTESAWDKKFVEQRAHYQEVTKEIRDAQRKVLDPYREAGVRYQKERYLTDSRDSIFKPEKEWTALDRWVNHRHKTVTAETGDGVWQYLRLAAETKEREDHTPDKITAWKEYERLQKELRKFDEQRPPGGSAFYTAATELGHSDSPPTFIRFAGIHERPTEEVQPAIPALWGGDKVEIKPTAGSSGRRSALANWLASPNNPLTARVYVNRVWAQYFDKGIVPTLNDFGRAGEKPTNPELLDYLAARFVENGWSIKKLQREIMLSSTYRQSSAERPEVAQVDPQNKLLAVYPRKRLEAEEIRDALLYASGQLNDVIGGPSVFPPVASVQNVGAADFDGNRAWTVSKSRDDWNRRSIYVFSRRSLPYPLLQNFDPANPSQAHHKRDVTTTPLQALTLFNSDIVINWSQALAGRIINEAGKDESAQISRLYQILFSREPSKEEKAALKDFLAREQGVVQKKLAGNGVFQAAVPIGIKDSSAVNPVQAAAFVDLVHAVANSNDFAYRF